MESTTVMTDAKVELANGKEALPVLEIRASAYMSSMCSTMEGRDRMQSKLAPTSGRLKVDKQAPTAPFDHLKRHSNNVGVAKAAVQEHIKSISRNYTQAVFHQVRQSPKSYYLHVEIDISSLQDGIEARPSKYVCPNYQAF